MEVQFDSQMTAKKLYEFSINNVYRRPTGVIWIIFSAVVAYVTVYTWNTVELWRSILMILLACAYTVLNPIMLYFKSKAQIRKNESFHKPLHYTINENGVSISQDDKTDSVKWLEMWKAVRYGKLIIVYVSSLRAFILPIEDIGDQLDTMLELLNKGLANRNYVKIKKR